MRSPYHYAWLLALFGAAAVAQGGDDRTDADKDHEVQVVFANGSTVRLSLLQDRIEVATRYGPLTVPLKEVQRIEFGVRLPALLERKVEAAVRKLASPMYIDRDIGERELQSAGALAYPAALKASKSADMEVARRAGKVVNFLREKFTEKELRSREEDIIHTPGFVILGRIVTPALKAHSEYFGDVSLQLVQLRHLRSLHHGGEAEISIDAARHGSASGQWLDTGYQVEGTGTLLVTASGSVDIYPQTPGQYMSTPTGYQGPGLPARPPARLQLNASNMRNYPGALVGRIGDEGEPFYLGDRYEGSPGHDGRLQLHIVPSPWNNASSGSYQVKISAK